MDNRVRRAGFKSVILLIITLVIVLIGFWEKGVLLFYSNGIYPIIAVAFRFISSLVPFALGDFLYAGLIIFGIVKLVDLARRARRKELQKIHRRLLPLQFFNLLLLLFIAFKLLWGLNYARPKIASQLNISDKKYNVKELVSLGNYFVSKLNDLQPKISRTLSYSTADLRAKTIDNYKQLAEKNSFFTYRCPSFKPALNDYIVSKIGIEGYYNPISGEANINMKLPPWVLPFVACHEVAHQLGVAKEDEANLVAYLVGLQSKDPNFQYSVNYNMLRYILLEIRMKSPDDYLLLREKLNPALIANFKAENEFWRQYNGQMSTYMGIAFDKFLKLNRQKRGIKSYQDIVIWLWNLHKQEILARK